MGFSSRESSSMFRSTTRRPANPFPLSPTLCKNTQRSATIPTSTMPTSTTPTTQQQTGVVFSPNVRPLAKFLPRRPRVMCPIPSNDASTKIFLDKGYTLIFYDQRGTGPQQPPSRPTCLRPCRRRTQNNTSLHFRADNIVRDMEEVRRALFGSQPWALLSARATAASAASTYLSLFAALVSHVLRTGGVPPIGKTLTTFIARPTNAQQSATPTTTTSTRRMGRVCGPGRRNLAPEQSGFAQRRNLVCRAFPTVGSPHGRPRGTDGSVLVTELWYAIETAGSQRMRL